ncbi:VOC family protein, partial [Bifidobacterium adolescentis]
MAKPMTAFTTDLQHSGMIAKDLDETIKFYREVMGFELAGLFMNGENPVSYTHLRAHETLTDPVCRLLLEKNNIELQYR